MCMYVYCKYVCVHSYRSVSQKAVVLVFLLTFKFVNFYLFIGMYECMNMLVSREHNFIVCMYVCMYVCMHDSWMSVSSYRFAYQTAVQ